MFVSKCLDDTVYLAKKIGEVAFPSMVICLNGEMGSGKTFFVSAFKEILHINEAITSPTFSIIKEYEGNLNLYHMDVYRLNGCSDGVDIESYYDMGGIVMIEWANDVIDILPDRLDINFSSVDGVRYIDLVGFGDKYVRLVEELVL